MSRNALMSLADEAAAKYGIDPDIFKRQIGAESNWNVNARSPAGALGVAQFMPATAKGMGVNPMDPRSALFGAARYMSNNLKQFGGDYSLALAAYNAGGGNARKALKSFPETKNYVAKILGGKTPTAGPLNGPTSMGLDVAPQSSPMDSPLNAIAQSLSARRPRAARAVSILAAGQPQAHTASPLASNAPINAGKMAGPGKGEPGWRYLQRIGQQKFGLRNDAGNSQTNGGGHTKGSEHYSDRAIDWGTAKNTPSQLAAWQKWAKAQGYDVLNEGDHIHTSLPGRGI